MRYFAFIFALLIAGPAASQSLNCVEPQTQNEMNGCAKRDYEAADGDLNLAWKLARQHAKDQDAYLEASQVPSAQMLLDAQRSWITYRDQACEAESTLARGGSIQPLIFYTCLERLTRQRTEDLRFFGEVN